MKLLNPYIMFHGGIIFAITLIFEITYCLPLEEKIEPVELYYRCINPKTGEVEPDKSPVLLLHALLYTHESYDGVDQLIADQTKRKVCLVDLRNHGESPWNNRTDVEAFAVDIGHFLDMQNIKKVNLIGESLGGKVAIHYSLKNPDRVESLIAEDTRPNTITSSGLSFVKIIVLYLKRTIDSQPKDMDENESKKWAERESEKLLETFRGYEELPEDTSKYIDLHQVNGKWKMKHNLDLLYEKVKKHDEIWTESKGLYTGPTLFIYGTESSFRVEDDKETILKLFPNAQLVPIEGAGHLLHETRREFDDIVVKFLNGIK